MLSRRNNYEKGRSMKITKFADLLVELFVPHMKVQACTMGYFYQACGCVSYRVKYCQYYMDYFCHATSTGNSYLSTNVYC